MHTGELLYLIAEHGVSLRCGRTEDRLHYAPAGTLPPELVGEFKERKQELIRILREDEVLRRTGKVQSEHQILSGPQLLLERR
jgi:hypothetical protein